MRHERPEAAPSTTARPATNRPSSRRPSDREALKFQWETFSAIAEEMLPLLRRRETPAHWPLEPDWDRWFEYERVGMLKIWTARSETALVGYVVCLVAKGLNSVNVTLGLGYLFWLAPEWRHGFVGLQFLRSAERALAELGVQVLRFNTDDIYEPDPHGRSRVGMLFRRAGYRAVETVYEKVLIDGNSC